MATGKGGTKPIYYGKFADASVFMDGSCTISFEDRQHVTVEYVGEWNSVMDLTRNVFPGSRADIFVSEEELPQANKYYVESISRTREEGLVGKFSARLSYAPKGPEKAISVTYTIEMQEVQKNLETHYLLNPPKETSASRLFQKEIRKWNLANEAARTTWGSDNYPRFWYYDLDEQGNLIGWPNPVVTKGGKKYCLAKTAGIDTYNLYLPVIQRVSTYLKLPGVKYDEETHEIPKGSKVEFGANDQDSGKIGQYCEPPILLEGYDDETKGKWFKSKDSYVMNADGSWTRTEEWVYTNDLNHTWIYSGTLDDEEE